jgi:hypothetical protein
MKIYSMNQCKLQKNNKITTSWIPTKYAIKGNYVKLKDNDVWENGWKVIEVFQPSKLSDSVINRSDDYKNTRKASDV